MEMGPAMDSKEICVPVASLSISDEGDDVAPEVGDPVEFSVTGTVTRVEGGNAYITPETVNGDPLPEEAAEGPAMMAEPNETDMLSMAQTADDEDSY